MKYKVDFKIDTTNYSITTEKEPSYVLKIASQLNDEVVALRSQHNLPITKSLVMTSFNYIDKYEEALDTIEHLRRELKWYISTNERLATELNDVKYAKKD